MPGHAHQELCYQLVEDFCVYLQAKNQLHLSRFSRDIAKKCKLLILVLWTFLATHTQNDSINLQKTLMFVCIPKINVMNHLFLKILHFKESCNLIV